MPDITNLEGGQWARVNSSAATMLIMALPETVKQEAVARRLENSSTKLVYRLLQIYQPGGENEKVKILGHLPAPPPESDPQRAVESLRTWNRWLRRCRELVARTQCASAPTLSRAEWASTTSLGEEPGCFLQNFPAKVSPASGYQPQL